MVFRDCYLSGSNEASYPEGIQRLLDRFKDLFPEEIPAGLPPTRGIEHQTDLAPGAPLPNWPAYHVKPTEAHELERSIQELMKQGYPRESLSPCAVPVLIVPKMDGTWRTWRMRVDCHAINTLTAKYRHPIPWLDNMNRNNDIARGKFLDSHLYRGTNLLYLGAGKEVSRTKLFQGRGDDASLKTALPAETLPRPIPKIRTRPVARSGACTPQKDNNEAVEVLPAQHGTTTTQGQPAAQSNLAAPSHPAAPSKPAAPFSPAAQPLQADTSEGMAPFMPSRDPTGLSPNQKAPDPEPWCTLPPKDPQRHHLPYLDPQVLKPLPRLVLFGSIKTDGRLYLDQRLSSHGIITKISRYKSFHKPPQRHHSLNGHIPSLADLAHDLFPNGTCHTWPIRKAPPTPNGYNSLFSRFFPNGTFLSLPICHQFVLYLISFLFCKI